MTDWWNHDFYGNYFIKFLSRKYNIIQSEEPDYLLCSLFGEEHFQYDCIKIFFTGEDVIPDFNLYDYALGFCDLTFADRYLRFPLPFLYTHKQQPIIQLVQSKHQNITYDLSKREFCSFVVSNKYAHPIREKFFDALSAYKFVASGGRFKNNIGRIIADKHTFISSYKFNIAFENTSSPHYCTEKLIQAFCAKTIPIYWGDSEIDQWINPKALINLSNFSSMDEAIQYILYLDSNPQAYLKVLQEKAFLIDDLQQTYEQKLEKFFDHIFTQPISKASRRQNNLSYWYRKRVHDPVNFTSPLLQKINFTSRRKYEKSTHYRNHGSRWRIFG